MIPGDVLSAFPHRQFHTLPGLLDSWAALPNSNPNACMPMQGGSLYHFYDGLWYDPAERRTHDLPCERRTRYRLSQLDTVKDSDSFLDNRSQMGGGGFLVVSNILHGVSKWVVMTFIISCRAQRHVGFMMSLVGINKSQTQV